MVERFGIHFVGSMHEDTIRLVYWSAGRRKACAMANEAVQKSPVQRQSIATLSRQVYPGVVLSTHDCRCEAHRAYRFAHRCWTNQHHRQETLRLARSLSSEDYRRQNRSHRQQYPFFVFCLLVSLACRAGALFAYRQSVEKKFEILAVGGEKRTTRIISGDWYASPI